jgi:hypothetical protein
MKKINTFEKIYFTFGNGKTMPLRGGWLLILAENIDEAIEIFRQYFPDKTPGTINCSTYRFEDEFLETDMYISNDNLGANLHMVLFPEDVCLEITQRDQFDTEENSFLQTCMHCSNLLPKDILHWINDRNGIPFKKICETCDPIVLEEVNNMPNYDNDECIDEY